MPDELARQHPPLATTPGAAQAATPVGDDSGRRGPEHGLRAGAGAGGDDSSDTRPDRATRFVETTRGTLSYAELAPLLAGRVATAEAELYREAFAGRPLDESLFLDLHTRICGDLVPDWAGRWRPIEVRVGNLQPPLPHEVPLRMRDYALDLQAGWPEATATLSDLTLAPPTSPRWKPPTVATFSRSWTSGATASPTPKRRKPEQIFDSQKL